VNSPLQVSYVLPVRMTDDRLRAELSHYLEQLTHWCEDVIVVDGSPEEFYEANAATWTASVRHVPPAPDHRCQNGKVAGVRTGLDLARFEHVVIADDDVRYQRAQLGRVAAMLATHDLVRPQNVFDAFPWHARWDTARSLLNRALGADYPGTLGLRRSRYQAMGGYCGDVLFENLELIRTVEAHGGRVAAPLDLYVRRRPPTVAHFWGQRTRQAYDDFAQPVRMVCWLAILPLSTAGWLKRRQWLLGAAAASIAMAERGRRRAGGAAVFPTSSSLFAPLWLAERGLCAWLAVLQRLGHGGVRYGDIVLTTPAHSVSALRTQAQNAGT
jgi:hypothetical protein